MKSDVKICVNTLPVGFELSATVIGQRVFFLNPAFARLVIRSYVFARGCQIDTEQRLYVDVRVLFPPQAKPADMVMRINLFEPNISGVMLMEQTQVDQGRLQPICAAELLMPSLQQQWRQLVDDKFMREVPASAPMAFELQINILLTLPERVFLLQKIVSESAQLTDQEGKPVIHLYEYISVELLDGSLIYLTDYGFQLTPPFYQWQKRSTWGEDSVKQARQLLDALPIGGMH
jgi:hypothetical protein